MTRNLTTGSPAKVIVLFTIPVLLGNVFQQIYHFTDAVVVGRLLGVNALAAIGSTTSVLFLLLGFTFGAAGGLAIPIARATERGTPPPCAGSSRSARAYRPASPWW